MTIPLDSSSTVVNYLTAYYTKNQKMIVPKGSKRYWASRNLARPTVDRSLLPEDVFMREYVANARHIVVGENPFFKYTMAEVQTDGYRPVWSDELPDEWKEDAASTGSTQQNKNFVELKGRLILIFSCSLPANFLLAAIIMDYRTQAPQILRDFLAYHETIQGHSRKTADEYFLDLRTFFRYIKIEKGLVPRSAPLDEISIEDVDLALVRSVTLADIYAYLSFLTRDRIKNSKAPDSGYGLQASTRARKVATIRSFYKYLVNKAKVLDENPIQELDSPKQRQSLPRYLTLDECIQLLESISGENAERDFCIITLFLNCGVRISELVGLNLTDIRGDRLRVLGKGNKERIVFLNAACLNAIEDWLSVRSNSVAADPYALFITRKHTRITTAGVHYMLKQRFLAAGLDSTKYSAHKLRHTAATLMLQNGVDVRTLQEVLGHEHLNTTQIYTHVDSDSLRNAAQSNPLGQVKARSKAKTETGRPS